METQNLAKWISELQAQIDQVKRLAIAAGSSGGDTVTITPTLDSGEKIADYAIGDTEGALYAPGLPAFTNSVATKIGTLGGRNLYRVFIPINSAVSGISEDVLSTYPIEMLFELKLIIYESSVISISNKIAYNRPTKKVAITETGSLWCQWLVIEYLEQTVTETKKSKKKKED